MGTKPQEHVGIQIVRNRTAGLWAWQWLGQPRGEWPSWPELESAKEDNGSLTSGKGRWICRHGNWLVTHPADKHGAVHPIDPETFVKTYERVTADANADLLVALKRLREKYRLCARAHGNDDETINASADFADAAIAKAEGR